VAGAFQKNQADMKLLLLLAASCATVLAALHADTIVENLGDDDYYARRLWAVVHL
jgi:hypothetical protein